MKIIMKKINRYFYLISEFEVEWKENPWQFMIEIEEAKEPSK